MSIDYWLEIDAGNSFFKWRILQGGRSLDSGRNERSSLETWFISLARNYPQLKHVRMASVVASDFSEQLAGLSEHCEFECCLSAKVESGAGGVLSDYKNLETLGVDRWLAVLAARTQVDGAFVVVDCGTALTVDCVSVDDSDSGARHLGGYIVPGFRLMLGALEAGTRIAKDRIPECVERSSLLPGRQTTDAIAGGLLLSCLGLVREAIEGLARTSTKPVSLVVTGGGAGALLPHLRNAYVYKPDLVLDGLSIALKCYD